MSNLNNNSAVPVNQIDQRRLSNVSVQSATDLSEQNTSRRGSKREPEDDELDEEETGDEEGKSEKRAGRRKIKIEYIEDKSRRHITFSKRKAGIMKKAYELSTLTGTQVLLLVVSETGLVYTFTTPKLQPLVTKPEGKNLIQACLNAPDPPSAQEPSTPSRAPHNPPTYSNDSTPTVDGNNNDTVYDTVDRKPNNNSQISSAPPYAIGLSPYATNQYGGIPSNMAMNTSSGIPTTAASYISPSQYSQYAQQHMNQYAPQNSAYMGSPTGANNYWNQAAANTSTTANTTSSPSNNSNNSKVQYSPTMSEKK